MRSVEDSGEAESLFRKGAERHSGDRNHLVVVAGEQKERGFPVQVLSTQPRVRDLRAGAPSPSGSMTAGQQAPANELS